MKTLTFTQVEPFELYQLTSADRISIYRVYKIDNLDRLYIYNRRIPIPRNKVNLTATDNKKFDRCRWFLDWDIMCEAVHRETTNY